MVTTLGQQFEAAERRMVCCCGDLEESKHGFWQVPEGKVRKAAKTTGGLEVSEHSTLHTVVQLPAEVPARLPTVLDCRTLVAGDRRGGLPEAVPAVVHLGHGGIIPNVM